MRRPWRAPAQAAWTGAAGVERRGGWLCAGHGERRRRLRGAGGRRRGGGGQPDGRPRRGRTGDGGRGHGRTGGGGAGGSGASGRPMAAGGARGQAAAARADRRRRRRRAGDGGRAGVPVWCAVCEPGKADLDKSLRCARICRVPDQVCRVPEIRHSSKPFSKKRQTNYLPSAGSEGTRQNHPLPSAR